MNNSPEFHLDGKKLTGKKILLVTTAWNKDFLSPAVDAIQKECETFQVSCEVVFCPGSLEIPATILRKMTDDFDGVLALASAKTPSKSSVILRRMVAGISSDPGQNTTSQLT